MLPIDRRDKFMRVPWFRIDASAYANTPGKFDWEHDNGDTRKALVLLENFTLLFTYPTEEEAQERIAAHNEILARLKNGE